MYWANFLHIYQPPTQKEYWVKKIANESYRKLIKGFTENPHAKATLNINAGLTELFAKYACRDVIAGIRMLAERGQIELTASAKYHPFLPMMPKDEIVRQIELNTATNRRYFGSAYKPTGFFPPEMAYNRNVADVIAGQGYRWLILDELAFSGKIKDIDWTKTYTVRGHDNLHVFFREREASFRILSAEIGMSIFSGSMLIKLLGERVHNKEYLITAMDGETFGHHRPGLEYLLFDLYKTKELQPVTISELTAFFPASAAIEPRPSSWALMMKDIERNTPFSRWNDKHNTIHAMQWQLTNLAIQSIKRLKKTFKRYPRVRHDLDRALHSDQYWWASAMPWWSIEMIEAGAKDLRDVILESPVSKTTKAKAQQLYQNILFTAFDWQRSGKVDVLAKSADEDVTQRITTDIPYIPEAEFNSIIANLEKQMHEAASSQEYERAAQIRNRVNELKEKKDQITKR
ncbi:MAG: UvrB/UvrC motif-containing protein [Patescibacteria group bacterium]|nr:UvrB/UvrC motif-containing protein [Patescibacteria group bacterium]MDD5715967.1 UvrB/UvrC motif-containing protein [Patescibacteria group bacterium]